MTIDQAIQRVRERFPFQEQAAVRWPVQTYRNLAETVMRYLPPGSRILDFGAGPADKTAVLQELGYKCTAYDELKDTWHNLRDNRQRILQFAADTGIEYVVATDHKLPFADETFDLVMSNDVYEHLHDSPRELTNALLERVKPRGYLLITVPNAVNIRKRIDVLRGRTNLPAFKQYYWNPGPWRGHVREYVRDDMRLLAEYLGLEVMQLRSCHHMLEKVPRKALPLYMALTSVFTGWRDSWLLCARKPEGWRPKTELPPGELNRMLGEYCRFGYE
jgi:SAM-dependent methyltransferase